MSKDKKLTEEQFDSILDEWLRSEWIDQLVETRKEFEKFESFKRKKIKEATELLKETLKDMEVVFEGDEKAKAKEELMKEAKLRQDFQFAIQAGFQGSLKDYKKIFERDEALQDEDLMRFFRQAVSEGYHGDLINFKDNLYPEMKKIYKDQGAKDSDPKKK